MRQVSRLASRARLAPRTRPRPRWLRPVRIAALALGLTVLLGVVGHALDVTTRLAELRAAAGERLLALSADAGLVVRRVYAEGRVHTGAPELRQILERNYNLPILGVETWQLKARLESLPWVRGATVLRQLPDTLLVRLEEHRPLAIWQHEGRRRLIGQDGEVIPQDALGRFRRLPVLAGAGAPERARELFRLVGREPALARRVTGATLVGGRRWNIWLDNKIEVRLPESGGEEAWRFLAARQRATSLLGRAIEAIDLRHPDWLVLRVMDPRQPTAAGQRV